MDHIFDYGESLDISGAKIDRECILVMLRYLVSKIPPFQMD